MGRKRLGFNWHCKRKPFFQIYDLMITMKNYIPHLKKHSSAEFVDGSKGGAIFPTTNKKNLCRQNLGFRPTRSSFLFENFKKILIWTPKVAFVWVS